ncbi:MAG: amidohydrolase family protein, partial [Candidatus Hermodarchaeota archaeon]
HSHHDYVLLLYNQAQSFIRQGITSCVIGMCGESFAPIKPGNLDEIKEVFIRVSPLFGMIDIKWNSFAEYLAEIEKFKTAINVVPVVGYNDIRLAGGQAHENRPPTPEEYENMKNYLTQSMEAGAFGMSTGLIYAPQVFAKTEELINLAKVMAKYNGIYFTHMRDEGRYVIEALKEAIEIVEESKCFGGQISHAKISGRTFWGKSKEFIRLINEANERGINITCDQYPYNRGMSHLSVLLPPWVHEGGPEETLERLKKSEIQERIKEELSKEIEGFENIIKNNGFERIYITTTGTEQWKDIEGKSISEITKIKGKVDNWETLFDLLISEKLMTWVTLETMGEEDIRRIMTSRYQMFGTDGAGIPNLPSLGKYHPRLYGTYPRVLGKYVREEKVLTLEDAIRKMTSFPAQRLGFNDRGLLRENMYADIVIFNPDTVIDTATFEDSHQFPDGIIHVIVNGTIVVENNKQNRRRPGKVLRRPN